MKEALIMKNEEGIIIAKGMREVTRNIIVRVVTPACFKTMMDASDRCEKAKKELKNK